MVEDRVKHGDARPAVEGTNAGQEFIGDNTEAEQIALRAGCLSLDLFRGKILKRACDDSALRQQARSGCSSVKGCIYFGETEIEYFDQAIGSNHDVLGLDVAMDDSGLVRGAECRCGLADPVEDGRRVRERRLRASHFPERATLYKLHRDVQLAA
jgi:hypothetical protein